MTARPVLFSAPMVRALLAGTKSQTRRVVKGGGVLVDGGGRPFTQRWDEDEQIHWRRDVLCPYGEPGDLLWVKETWALIDDVSKPPTKASGVVYRATDERNTSFSGSTAWRPSIFMPRWASRLSLRITNVRVERLQDISEEDARAEGVSGYEAPEEWHAVREAASGHLEAIAFPEQPSKAVIKALKLRDVRRYPASTVLTAKEAFERLWESINGPESWSANPWCWAISFERVKA